MSLRQKGFAVAQNGRIFANEGEELVETGNGALYHLRFGEVATSSTGGGENRYLFVVANWDAARAQKYGDTSGAGEKAARDLNARFADWYYVISGADFQKLRLRKKDVLR
jgi:hypothetical protein